MKSVSTAPRRRSPYRLLLAGVYFRLKRYAAWYLSDTSYASVIDRQSATFLHLLFHHQTPLFRQLGNSVMWLQHNKVTNLRLAIEQLDGIVIRPGETFSFWRLVNRPTRRKGYVEGMVLCEGEVVPGVGGGLCQLSNLIYWMTLHTQLSVIERWRHNYDMFPDADRTQPFGSGATVAYNYIDLQLKNDTDQVFQLHLWLTADYLCGEWHSDQPTRYRYEVYQKDHLITHEYWGGYLRHNTIHRRVFSAEGEEIGDQFVTDNHAIMVYQPLLGEGKTGAD